ncbi:MAG: polysaccharide export protein [Boseongicola sp.]|nr:polysaccharide export protein [Boseongicola sp.]MDD9978771.1 polysaccharide export protein [Boseongicola sp.]
METMKTLLMTLVAMLFATFAAAQGYLIQSGDTLTVEVIEDPSLNRSVLVLPDGSINFPFAGSVPAKGRTATDVQSSITAAIASNFATQPTVFVTVQSLRPRVASTGGGGGRTIDVYMIGEIGSPGAKELRRGTTLLQALASTGGFTKFAATKRILLRRTDSRTGRQSVSRINYKAIAAGTSDVQDIVLADGDVIIVPERRLFE